MATTSKPKTKDKDICRLITPEFRVSYPHVFKPQAPKPTDTPKYSITMLFRKDSDLMGFAPGGGEPRGIKEVIRNAKILEFGDKENWPKDLESPVVDGDDIKFADKEGYKGCWVIKATTSEDQRPSVVDHEMVPIVEPAAFYPGCYARAYIYAYVWFYPNRQKFMKRGVGFILDHVQKLRDGKSFGGKKPVEQVFSPVSLPDDEVEDDADSDFR
jgi:hypothetical protein